MSDTSYRIEWYQIYTGVKDLSVIDKRIAELGYQRRDFRPARIRETYLCVSLEATIAADNHVAINPQEPRFILAPLPKPKRIMLVQVVPTPEIVKIGDYFRHSLTWNRLTPNHSSEWKPQGPIEIFRVESES